jgi:hypothetical protein
VKTNLLLLSSLIATGCGGGVSEDEFAAEFAKSYCAKMFECMDQKALDFMGWDDEEACRQAMDGDGKGGDKSDDCNYDSKAADDCLDAFDALSCDDLKSGTTTLPECDAEKICPSN